MCGRASPLRRVTPTPRSPIPWVPKTRSPHQSTELLKRVPHYEVTRTPLLPCLARRYQIAPPDVAELGRLLATRSIVLADVLPIFPTARDPADDRILALARAGHADHIVSGDADLHSLGRYQGIAILSPAAYARLLDEA